MNKSNDVNTNIDAKGIRIELCFKMGGWRGIFTENEYNMIIASALNRLQFQCRKDDKGNYIVAYMINPDEVYLIIHLEDEDENTTVDLFENILYQEIARFLNYIKSKKTGENAPQESLQNAAMDEEQLFTCYPINNWYLVKLITGQNIELPYYDPRLAMLKDQIGHNNFCSAIDYSGAVGPVCITILNRT